MKNLPPANVLPRDAAKLLQQAAQTPITRADPLARVKAIEKAIERVKREYPPIFPDQGALTMKLKLNNVRLAFPVLFEAKTVNGEGKPAFSASFLIDPADPQVKALNTAIDQVANDKWGAKAAAILKQMRATDKVALHDGDLKSNYDGFPGNLYVSARSTTRPLVINNNKSPLTEQDGKPYAGCYVNASIELWAQDNNYGKRVNASLRGVQFLRDGDAFVGGGAASEDEFDDISQGAAAEDLV